MKIDSHAHILPESWPSLKDKYGYGGFIWLDHFKKGSAKMMRDDGKFFREIQENCWSPEAIIKDMDQYRVDRMVLCTVPVLFNYWAKPEHTLDWSMFLNDHLAEIQKGHSQRFIGLGTLPMQDIPLDIQELKRCKELGLPGVEIGSHIEDKNLDDPSFFPFWKACEDLDMAVFVHPWDMMGQEKMPKYFLPWLVGMPAETSLAICSMIFGGVFDKFPKLRVMFAHGGGSFPFTVGRVSHGWHCRPDLCNVNQIKDPREYIGKFWVDGITHDTEALKFLIDTMGIDKIAYGTDYPFPLGDLEHGKFIEDSDLSADQKEQLLSKTLIDFLKL
ncbi:MAG: amidohydrolase [Bacteroidota bacterium]|nr:amidohydrolase [Bacteroidota bacterium]MDX5430387.1 amidohydrolase [Bacteroidota bacterium]MDX5469148.1 amidohydrolase [Bacteroidota bacterium]